MVRFFRAGGFVGVVLLVLLISGMGCRKTPASPFARAETLFAAATDSAQLARNASIQWLAFRELGRAATESHDTVRAYAIFETFLAKLPEPVRVQSAAGTALLIDYGRNLLSGIFPKSVLFTFGDYDTYPLWFCQQVLDHRTDIVVVNLNLLRFKAYRQWMVQEANVALDCDISALDSLRAATNAKGDTIYPIDQMVQRIIESNYHKRTIFFSVTVPMNYITRLGAPAYLTGLAYQITEDQITPDTLRMLQAVNALDIYRYDRMPADSSTPPSVENLTMNYGVLISTIIEEKVAIGETTRVDECLKLYRKLYPSDWYNSYLNLIYKRSRKEPIDKELSELVRYQIMYSQDSAAVQTIKALLEQVKKPVPRRKG